MSPINGTAFATESPTTFVSSRPTSFGSSRRAGITGKLTGNFAESGHPRRFPHLIDELIQRLAAKFPTQRNREFLQPLECTPGNGQAGNREFAYAGWALEGRPCPPTEFSQPPSSVRLPRNIWPVHRSMHWGASMKSLEI